MMISVIQYRKTNTTVGGEKRKGKKPSPGTIYPVLKHMKEKNLLLVDDKKSYTLTEIGKKTLEGHLDAFIKTFYDIDEMKSCCSPHGRHFLTKEEKIKKLLQYKDWLDNESKGIEEAIEKLKSN